MMKSDGSRLHVPPHLDDELDGRRFASGRFQELPVRHGVDRTQRLVGLPILISHAVGIAQAACPMERRTVAIPANLRPAAGAERA